MIPMCQDTGIVVVFAKIGYDIHFNCDLYDAINFGVSKAYNDFYLRKSVADPLSRINTKDNTPAIVHTVFTKGDMLELTIALKGAGSENMSKLKMLNPTDGYEGITDLSLKPLKKQVEDLVLLFLLELVSVVILKSAPFLLKRL